MTIRVELAIENASHFLFKDTSARTVFLKKVKGALSSDVAPKSEDAAKVVWELEPDFDRIEVSVGYRYLSSLDFITHVMQAFTFDGTVCVESPQNANPRAFAAHANPLLQSTATTAGGVSRLDLKFKTQVVDFTQVMLFLQAHRVVYTMAELRAARNAGSCDVRIVALVGDKDDLRFLAVMIPPAARTASGPVGAMVFYAPGSTKPKLKGKNEAGVLDELADLCYHAGRFTRSPALDKAGSTPVDAFGPNQEDDKGFWPNAIIARQVALVNRPMIFVITWGGSGTLPPDHVGRVIAFLWGQGKVATAQDQGVKLGRFGISGFSFGGQAALDAVIAVGSRASEVWLFDPKFNQTPTDTGPDADKRHAAVVSWYLAQGQDPTRMLRLVCGVYEVRRFTQIRSDVHGAKNFATNFTLAPSGFASHGIAYYGIPKLASLDADFKKAYQWFIDGWGEKQASDGNVIAGIAHQWVVVGGEGYATKKRTDTNFLTYLGDCLQASGY